MKSPPAEERPTDDHRQRLTEALGALLVTKGYHVTSISDIVSQARVSKRTFYEQFDTKEACLLALCDATAERALAVLAASYNPNLPWEEQLIGVTRSYLEHLQSEPSLIRALFIDLLSIGPRGLAARREIMQRFADFLTMQVEFARLREPDKRALSADMAAAVVGGINELILRAVEKDEVDRLINLAEPACDLVRAVVTYLEPARA